MELEPWQLDLINIFTELDQDGSGSLTTVELRQALAAAGVAQARLVKLIRLADSHQEAQWMPTEYRIVKENRGKYKKI